MRPTRCSDAEAPFSARAALRPLRFASILLLPDPAQALLCEIPPPKLRAATEPAPTATILAARAQPRTGSRWRRCEITFEAICKGEVRPIVDPAKPATFQQLAERWTLESSRARTRIQVKTKSTAERDRQRLEHYVYPFVGATPIARFTLDDAGKPSCARCLPVARHTRDLRHARPGEPRRRSSGPDRTGHRSSDGINRYRRAARTAAELGLGRAARFDVALPAGHEGRERRRTPTGKRQRKTQEEGVVSQMPVPVQGFEPD